MAKTGCDGPAEGDILGTFGGLRDRDYRSRGLFAIEGRIVFEKALAAGVVIRSVLCVNAASPEWEPVCRDRGIPFRSLPAAEISGLAGYAFHRGILAVAERPAESRPDAIPVPEGDILVLWQVSDPDNLGALIRSAAALGARAVCVGPGCADPLGRKALRSSMGNALSRPLFFLDGLGGLHALKAGGRRVLAAALGEGAGPFDASRRSGVATVLVLGNEGYGLPAEVADACDGRVMVPMPPDVDSLNVGAAGAILMYGLFDFNLRAGYNALRSYG